MNAVNGARNIPTVRAKYPGARGLPELVNTLFRKLMIIIPIGIIGNLVYCLATTDTQMLASIAHVHPVYLAGAALLSIVPWFTGSFRLFTWSRFLGQPLRYRDAFSIAVSADLGAAIAPPAIGGGAVKVGMLIKQGRDAGTALSLLVLENLEDALFFLIMVPPVLIASSPLKFSELCGITRLQGRFWELGVLASALCAVLFLVRSAKVHPWLRSFRDRIGGVARAFLETFWQIGRGGKKILIITLFMTGLQWICRYSIVSLLFASLDMTVRPVLFIALQVLVFACTVLVPSPGGAGGAELIFSFVYNPFLPPGMLGLVTTGWRFFTFYLHTMLAAVLTLIFSPVHTSGEKADTEYAATTDTTGSLLLKEEPCFVREQPARHSN